MSGTTSNSDTGTKDAPEVAKMAPEDGSSTRPTAPITHVNTTQSPHARNLRILQKLEESFGLGYDSDGEIGPFINMEEVEGVQIFEKMEMGERNDLTTVVTNDTDGGGNDNVEVIKEMEDDMDNTPLYIPIDEGKLTKMSREELKMSYG